MKLSVWAILIRNDLKGHTSHFRVCKTLTDDTEKKIWIPNFQYYRLANKQTDFENKLVNAYLANLK